MIYLSLLFHCSLQQLTGFTFLVLQRSLMEARSPSGISTHRVATFTRTCTTTPAVPSVRSARLASSQAH